MLVHRLRRWPSIKTAFIQCKPHRVGRDMRWYIAKRMYQGNQNEPEGKLKAQQ